MIGELLSGALIDVYLWWRASLLCRKYNRDTDYFDIVAGVQQGEILAPYLFIIFLDYMLRMPIDIMKNNGFKLQRKEAEDTPHKQLLMRTTPMTLHFWQNMPTQAVKYTDCTTAER